jgi:hypothetical protein
MPSLPTDNIRRYYTESCNKITSHAIITDGISVGKDVGNYPWNFRRIYSVGNVPAGNFFLARAYPSVIPSMCPSVGVFFCDRISDGNGIYRRLLYRRTCSIGESVGMFFTDGMSPSVKLDNVVVMQQFQMRYWTWIFYHLIWSISIKIDPKIFNFNYHILFSQ